MMECGAYFWKTRKRCSEISHSASSISHYPPFSATSNTSFRPQLDTSSSSSSVVLILLLCLMIIGRGGTQIGADATKDELIVTTENGRVRGIRYYLPSFGKAVDAFLGIPFAKEPTGHYRFRHPQPLDRWSGIHNATKLPNSCYQQRDDMYGPEFYGSNMWNPTTKISEDCLYLNVWVPKTHPRVRKSAVMVWIYGGGFYTGTTTLNLYDGRILAAENNVIVVSIGYRVGVFGFLYLNDAAAPGNAGMFDQLMGLEWVQQNIRHFGGDPDNVTIYGESAGAASVSLHLLSPLSASKFQRAILQSGTANMPWATLTPTEAKRRALELAFEVLGCPITTDMSIAAECLRTVSPQKLSENQYVARGPLQFPFLPVIDGTFLVDSPDNLIRQHQFKKCPLLIGSNLNEGSFFVIYELTDYLTLEKTSMTRKEFDKSIDQLFFYYPQYNKEMSQIGLDAIKYQYTHWLDQDDMMENVAAIDRALGESQFVCPLNDFALAYASAGEEVYMYYLTQRYNTNPWPEWMGVLHGDDIFYVFGESLKLGLNFSQGDKDLSRQVMLYWTNFAKTGNPNVIPGVRTLDDWPLHTPQTREYLELNARFINNPDKSKAIGRGPKIKECAFWNKYLPRLIAKTGNVGHNDRLTSPADISQACSSRSGSTRPSASFFLASSSPLQIMTMTAAVHQLIQVLALRIKSGLTTTALTT